MDSHGCLGSLFCIVCQNKWTDMAAWVLSSALSVRTNGLTWLLTCLLFNTGEWRSQQADTPSHFTVRNCRFSSTKCTVTTGRHSVTLLCPELSLLFHKVHRHNRPTLRHTSLSGTVASPPQSTPSEQADTPSHFIVRNCRFSSTMCTKCTRADENVRCPWRCGGSGSC